MYWLIIAAFLIVLGFNIWASSAKIRLLEYVTKPLLTILLIVFYTVMAKPVDPIIILALIGGLSGDVFLMLPDRNAFFIVGLLSFLAGHLLYILAFIKTADLIGGPGIWFYLLSIPYIICGVVIFLRLSPFTGRLKPFVAGYITTIVCMGIASLTSIKQAGNLTFLVPVAGALLFMVSDTYLAFGKFKKTRCDGGIIMITYGLAQMLITIWFAIL